MGLFKTCHSGKDFDFEAPSVDAVDINDIIHALPNLCRFLGHTDFFYSVAQHCIIGTEEFLKEGRFDEAYEFLMHDAEEVYVGDLPTTLKPLCPDYKRAASGVDRAIRQKFHLPLVITPSVKGMDRRMLATEKQQIVKAVKDEHWPMLDGYPPLDVIIEERSISDVREHYARLYYRLSRL